MKILLALAALVGSVSFLVSEWATTSFSYL